MRMFLPLLAALLLLPGLRPLDDDADLEIHIMRLGDESATWRAKAARAIAAMGARGRLAVSPLAGLVEDDEDAAVRAAAAQALGAIGVSARKEGEDPLIAALGDDDASVRLIAASALVDIEAEDRKACAALAKAVQKDDDHRVRANAARALSTLARTDRATVAALARGLSDDHWTVRVNAAAGIGDAGEEGGRASKALLGRLGDESEAVRAMVARALGLVPGDTKRTPQMLSAALERERALLDAQRGADAPSGPEDAVLVRHLAETGGARRNLVWALGRQIAGGRDVTALLETVENDDPVEDVRKAARTAIERRARTALPAATEEQARAWPKVPELPWDFAIRGCVVLRVRFDEKTRAASD